jgi:HD-GYP domain-containing protein (c-di-GMP phosphodiesterase class II)
MIKDPGVTVFDLARCVSEALDLVSPELVNHHLRVASLVAAIAGELEIRDEPLRNLVIAALLHDIGAVSISERIGILAFEDDPEAVHARRGGALLGTIGILAPLAPLVLHHHARWDAHDATHEGSHLIHLADRVAVQMKPEAPILSQVDEIVQRISALSGSVFNPDHVLAFIAVSKKESFWLDSVSNNVIRDIKYSCRSDSPVLSVSQLNELALFFARLIDFRNAFTATHSCSIAAIAESLAHRARFPERECSMMRIAGFLHDLGKLAVPGEILEKPGNLTPAEFSIVRTHTYHTFRILEGLNGFDTINVWASFHHERLDGSGYPFHHDQRVLSLGSRIVAVADVFTALTEERPYREAMSLDKAVGILRHMANANALDPSIVSLLETNAIWVDSARTAARQTSLALYLEFKESGAKKPNTA